MIRVGGNAFNNGVKFHSEKFNISFEMSKDMQSQLFLRQSMAEKHGTLGKLLAFFSKIPFIRGVYSLVKASPLIGIMLLLMIAMDFVPFPELGADGGGATFIILNLASYVLFGILLYYMISKVLIKGGRTLELHGAEHKVIWANDHNLELTVENVRKAPRISPNCGTIFLVIFFLVFSGVSFLPIPYESVIYILSIMVAYEIFKIKNGEKLPVISLLYQVGYWCQKYLFTREPSDAQLLEAIKAFQILVLAETNQLDEEKLQELLDAGRQAPKINRFF